jgi:hypothetical protein
MSTIKLVAEIGVRFIPVVGQALGAALGMFCFCLTFSLAHILSLSLQATDSSGADMATNAAHLISYVYPEHEDPEGAFSWWLSPCGGTNLVPDDIKKVYNILSQVPNGVSSFKTPQKFKPKTGKKGDKGNPKDRSKPRSEPSCKESGPQPNQRVIAVEDTTELIARCRSKKKKPCKIPPAKASQRHSPAKNTYRELSCVADKTVTNEIVITSLIYAPNAAPTQIAKPCKEVWSQACFHYSSAIRVNPQWRTLTCPHEAAHTSHRQDGSAKRVWKDQHKGDGSLNKESRRHKRCDRDEYPPAYLLSPNDPAILYGGMNARGQLVRYILYENNQQAGQMWKGACFGSVLRDMSDAELKNKVARSNQKQVIRKPRLQQTMVAITVSSRPEFSISDWGHSNNPPPDDGLRDNECLPNSLAAIDPGFALLTYDPYYKGRPPPFDYKAKFEKGKNGPP